MVTKHTMESEGDEAEEGVEEQTSGNKAVAAPSMKCLLEPQQQDLPPHNCSLIDNWFRDVGGVLREEHVVLMAEETDEDDEFRIILFLHFLVSSPASELAVRPKFYHLCFHFLFFLSSNYRHHSHLLRVNLLSCLFKNQFTSCN